MVSFSEELRVRMSSADSAEARMETGMSFGTAPCSQFFMFETSPSSWRVIEANGPIVCYDMVGFLV